jgi:hypothetical protein
MKAAATCYGIRISPLTLRRLLLLAIHALLFNQHAYIYSSRRQTYLATSNLERCGDSVTLLKIRHAWSKGLNDTTELVAKNVAFLHLNDCSMKYMQVRSAGNAASDLENDVAVFNYTRFGYVLFSRLARVQLRRRIRIKVRFYNYHREKYFAIHINNSELISWQCLTRAPIIEKS